VVRSGGRPREQIYPRNAAETTKCEEYHRPKRTDVGHLLALLLLQERVYPRKHRSIGLRCLFVKDSSEQE